MINMNHKKMWEDFKEQQIQSYIALRGELGLDNPMVEQLGYTLTEMDAMDGTHEFRNVEADMPVQSQVHQYRINDTKIILSVDGADVCEINTEDNVVEIGGTDEATRPYVDEFLVEHGFTPL